MLRLASYIKAGWVTFVRQGATYGIDCIYYCCTASSYAVDTQTTRALLYKQYHAAFAGASEAGKVENK